MTAKGRSKRGMNHKEWAKKLATAFSLRKSDPSKAVSLIKKLFLDVESELKGGLNLWHLQQTLGSQFMIHEESGRTAAACRTLKRLLEIEEQTLRYYGKALALHAAEMALLKFELKRNAEAVRLGEEALKLMGQFMEPSIIHVKLIPKILEEYRRRAARKRKARPGRTA